MTSAKIYAILDLLVNANLTHFIITGVDFMVRSGFREYEEEKLCFPACCSQANAIFSPHVHGTRSAS